jgi:DNA-binding protein H-NS
MISSPSRKVCPDNLQSKRNNDMLERTYIPHGSGRLQREILVVPPKKETGQTATLPQSYEQEVNSQVSVSGLLNPISPSAGQKIKRVIAELEKRRAELFTMALEATARAQEAEQKRAEAEAIARAALEKVHKIEKIFMGAGADPIEDAERHLVFGLLVFSNDKEKKAARKASKRKVTATAPLNARRQPALIEYEVRGQGLWAKLKFAFYGLGLALLLLVAGWLLVEFFL